MTVEQLEEIAKLMGEGLRSGDPSNEELIMMMQLHAFIIIAKQLERVADLMKKALHE
jgi:hypothetical protein